MPSCSCMLAVRRPAARRSARVAHLLSKHVAGAPSPRHLLCEDLVIELKCLGEFSKHSGQTRVQRNHKHTKDLVQS